MPLRGRIRDDWLSSGFSLGLVRIEERFADRHTTESRAGCSVRKTAIEAKGELVACGRCQLARREIWPPPVACLRMRWAAVEPIEFIV
jgi:hypothetical protein